MKMSWVGRRRSPSTVVDLIGQQVCDMQFSNTDLYCALIDSHARRKPLVRQDDPGLRVPQRRQRDDVRAFAGGGSRPHESHRPRITLRVSLISIDLELELQTHMLIVAGMAVRSSRPPT